jgi:rod shape-determining protein MreC
MFRSVSGFCGRQTEWIWKRRSLATENQKLRQENEALRGRLSALTEAQISYDRLRGDLGFVKQAKPRLLAADVIAYKIDPKFDTMMINRGTSDGIGPNSVVVTRDGVVGRVFEAESGTSTVLMITDQRSGIGVRVQRPESCASAVCEGDNTTTLVMLGMPDSGDVRAGDVLVTSGLGGVYPAGLVVGSVADLRPDTANGGRIIRVKPQVVFERLEQVYVIK